MKNKYYLPIQEVEFSTLAKAKAWCREYSNFIAEAVYIINQKTGKIYNYNIDSNKLLKI